MTHGRASDTRLPAIFLGHGNPMNALADNGWTRAWRAIGASLPRPRAVLCVSAHWYGPFSGVTAMARPRTIHDFGGFPRELFEYEYPAPGAPELADEVRAMLLPEAIASDHDWGLDHGAWSVLCHAFPRADVPVVQLAIDSRLEPAGHYALGRRLAPLRDRGVLVLGSGNVVHNLQAYGWGRAVEPYDWALRFESLVREALLAGDHERLVDYRAAGRDGAMSVPTPEHYLPLLYVLGACAATEAVDFPAEGIDGGSISMLAARIGQAAPAAGATSPP